MAIGAEQAIDAAMRPRYASLLRTFWRYGVSTLGPLAVSGAHFLASLIFLRNLPAHEFGLFSFVMVIVPFSMSMGTSLIIVPITSSLVSRDGAIRPACFKMNWLLCLLFTTAIFLALRLSHAAMAESGLLALFGGVFVYRWFARCFAYVEGRIVTALASDLTYSLLLIAALAGLALTRQVHFLYGSAALLVAALAGLIPFGREFFRQQFGAFAAARWRDYVPIFRDLTRWSLIGVVLTEVTVNAHAYLVTFLSGAGAFALLALGMLLLRPASLVQSALPDMERPAMARAIAARDWQGLARIRRDFTFGLGAAWLVNILLCAGLLTWAPQLLLKKGYALDQVAEVAALSAIIMALRIWRTPLAVVLQAAGKFKALAGIGILSGAVSVLATLALLLMFGPVASLGGILLGEIVILVRCRDLERVWKQGHD